MIPLFNVWGKAKDKLSVFLLVAMNLIPLGGAIFAEWDTIHILLIYWAENLVVGFYNALKMAMARGVSIPSNSQGARFFLIPFFLVHYGFFCFVHGTLVLALGEDTRFLGEFNPLGNLVDQISGPLVWPVLGLFISHGCSFAQNYVGQGEYKTSGLGSQMVKPYLRIIPLHVAIILGGFFLISLDSPLPMLVVLILIKIAIDLVLHAWSHRR